MEDKLTTGNLNLRCVVIPDDMADRLQPRRQVWSADYAGEDKAETEEQLLQLVRPLNEKVSIRSESRLSIYGDMMGNKILALFLGLYLGFTFLLAAAAVLVATLWMPVLQIGGNSIGSHSDGRRDCGFLERLRF